MFGFVTPSACVQFSLVAMTSRRVRRSLFYPSCFKICGSRSIQKDMSGMHFEEGSGVVPNAGDPPRLSKPGLEVEKQPYPAPTRRPTDGVKASPAHKPSTQEAFAQTDDAESSGACVQTQAQEARPGGKEERPMPPPPRWSSLISPFFPHGNTRQRADNNSSFPNRGELALRLRSAVEGNVLSWLEEAEGVVDLETMCRAVAVTVDWAGTHFRTTSQHILERVRNALSVDEQSRRALALDPLLVYTVEEHVRAGFEEIFLLGPGNAEMFRSSTLSGFKARLLAEGLGVFVERERLAEAVARDMLWVTVGCALSGPPFYLSPEGIGHVETYDSKRHVLVDGEAAPRVRVLFPAVPELLPQSLCLPDVELRD